MWINVCHKDDLSQCNAIVKVDLLDLTNMTYGLSLHRPEYYSISIQARSGEVLSLEVIARDLTKEDADELDNFCECWFTSKL